VNFAKQSSGGKQIGRDIRDKFIMLIKLGRTFVKYVVRAFAQARR
jgi:hypothetical protein